MERSADRRYALRRIERAVPKKSGSEETGVAGRQGGMFREVGPKVAVSCGGGGGSPRWSSHCSPDRYSMFESRSTIEPRNEAGPDPTMPVENDTSWNAFERCDVPIPSICTKTNPSSAILCAPWESENCLGTCELWGPA